MAKPCAPIPAAFAAPILLAAMALLAVLGACDRHRSPADASALHSGPHHHADPDGPPNLILIVLDTTRADRMSHDGYPRTTSPYIDAFSRDAVVYGQAHSVAPWTLPAHMSMFTGLLPGQHGATWQAFATPEDMSLDDILDRSLTLADPARLLTQRLRRLGYTNVGFSSNAWVARRTGFDQGFDAFYEMWKESEAFRGRLHWPSQQERMAADMAQGDAGYVLLQLEKHLATHGTLQEPFFLFFNFIDPHFPYSPPTLWRYSFSDDRELGEKIADFHFSEMALVAGARPIDVAAFAPFYDAEINYLDFVVGRLLGWLRETGYYDESLIVITSDHGEHLGEGGRFSHQFSIEEELLRIPMVIKYPHGDQAGSRVENPLVSNLDLYATLLAAANDNRHESADDAPSFVLPHDLRRMESFERPFLIAESYYALPFLRAHQQRFDGFPLDSHKVVRRVVFDGEARHLFLAPRESDPGASPEVNEKDDPARDRAAAFLQTYLANLEAGGMITQEQPLDEETRERLRALGYAN